MDGDEGGDELASPAPLPTLGDAAPAPPWIPRANVVVTLEPTHPKPCIACTEETRTGSHHAEEPPPGEKGRALSHHSYLPAQEAPSSSGRASLSPEGRRLQADGVRGSHGSRRMSVVGWKRGCAVDKCLQIIHAQCSRLNVDIVVKL